MAGKEPIHVVCRVDARIQPHVLRLAQVVEAVEVDVVHRQVAVVLVDQRECRAADRLAHPEAPAEPHSRRRNTLRIPAVWLSIGIFFIYCGIESSTGQWTYSLLVESRTILPVTAGLWISLYWGALTAGRFLIGTIANHVPPVLLLRLCMAGVAAGESLIGLRLGHGIEAIGLAVTGFSLAPIFPTLISLTPRRFDAVHVANVVGFQVAGASLGIAIVPAVVGVVARRAGLELLPGLMIASTLLMIVLHEMIVRSHREKTL